MRKIYKLLSLITLITNCLFFLLFNFSIDITIASYDYFFVAPDWIKFVKRILKINSFNYTVVKGLLSLKIILVELLLIF